MVQVVVITPRSLVGTIVLLVSLVAGCTSLDTRVQKDIPEESVGTWTLETYRRFLAENQKHLNHVYSDDYEEYLFLVDTDDGARPVQDLIDAESVRWLWFTIGSESLNESKKVDLCYAFISNRFRYVPMPFEWPTLKQTMESREGDCKGLSLLLISLLLSADIECYGAINHGHMWVNAKVDGKWQVLETDTDPRKNVIYQSPGFYHLPLFKVYQDKTQKRVRKKDQEGG